MGREAISRRRFMRSTMAGLGGLAALSSSGRSREGSPRQTRLVHRTLGKTGIRVPVIGMGIIVTGNPDLMQAALEAGIAHFDTTADPAQQEHNERMIGEVLAGRPRGSFVFGPKIHLPRDRTTGLYGKGATEAEFTKKLDASLKRLKMDSVDVLYHHDVRRKEAALWEPVLAAMEKAKKARLNEWDIRKKVQDITSVS